MHSYVDGIGRTWHLEDVSGRYADLFAALRSASESDPRKLAARLENPAKRADLISMVSLNSRCDSGAADDSLRAFLASGDSADAVEALLATIRSMGPEDHALAAGVGSVRAAAIGPRTIHIPL